MLIHKVEPQYTKEARDARFQGDVLLDAVIGTDGKPESLEVRSGLGLGLDEKAIECVRQWRFKPAYKSGQPVRMTVTIEVNFHL
jgi:periplasmic protein TonB